MIKPQNTLSIPHLNQSLSLPSSSPFSTLRPRNQISIDASLPSPFGLHRRLRRHLSPLVDTSFPPLSLSSRRRLVSISSCYRFSIPYKPKPFAPSPPLLSIGSNDGFPLRSRAFKTLAFSSSLSTPSFPTGDALILIKIRPFSVDLIGFGSILKGLNHSSRRLRRAPVGSSYVRLHRRRRRIRQRRELGKRRRGGFITRRGNPRSILEWRRVVRRMLTACSANSQNEKPDAEGYQRDPQAIFPGC